MGGRVDVDADWISTPGIPPDHRGPVDRPYTPFVDPRDALPVFTMLASIARARPDAVAVEDEAGSLTCAALVAAALSVARHIRDAQPAPGPVALLLPIGTGYAIALFAALAAGRCCVFLDAGYPDQRNASIIAQTGATLVLTGAATQPGPAWPGAAVIALTPDILGGTAPAGAASAPLELDAPAIIMATSGSSGTPKLVVHSQRTILNRVRMTHDALHVTPADRSLSLASPSSLTGVTGLFSVLGGAAVQLVDLKRAGIGGLIDLLATRPITILRAAPSLLRGLAELPQAARIFGGLRVVQTFGEPLTRADAGKLLAVMPDGCLLRTSYGATEANGFSWFVRADDAQDPVLAAAGTLMPDTMAAIVDEAGSPCARGEAGELWIRSRYNALGEWRDGAMTAGRLEPHPSGDGTRVYRTGDLARCDTDGVFVVLGRRDRMVKINGQRLDPTEVEATLRAIAGVGQAEVVVQRRGDSARLIAFVVPRRWDDPGLVATVRTRLREALPAFMVPARILLADAIPRLPGGKVDSLALLRLADERRAAPVAAVEPA